MKPFHARTHCLIDYVFVGIQTLGPVLLGLNPKTARRSQLLGAGVLVLNGLTRSPVAIKPEIPFRPHGRVDKLTLAGLALASFAPDIRNDRKSLAFHLGFLALATMNVVLTDWKSGD